MIGEPILPRSAPTMNITLINHYAGSNKLGMEYRPYYFAREFTKLGHNVTILAGSYSHLRSTQPNIACGVNQEEIDGICYVWFKTASYIGNGLARFLSMLQFVFRLFISRKKIIDTYKPDVVIASSTYPLDIYPAYCIAKASNAKLVFEVHDLWPLSPMEIGGMSRWHPFIILMQHAENFAYENADKVVSMLQKAEEHMKNHGMAGNKFVYIPNGVVLEEWEYATAMLPRQYTEQLCKLRAENRFLVGYAGGHGLSNSLDQMLEGALLLKELPVTMVLVGKGPEKERLQRKALELNISNTIFLPPIPKGAIPELLSLMDVLYLGWGRNPLYRFGICPNKLMDYMMAAKPIVHAVEAGNDLVSESGCGISVPPENPEAIAVAIQTLMDMSEQERVAMGLRGKEYVLKHHDYRVLAKRFLEIME
jgi:glycosyltransferase involved in cell wall biosynthesis